MLTGLNNMRQAKKGQITVFFVLLFGVMLLFVLVLIDISQAVFNKTALDIVTDSTALSLGSGMVSRAKSLSDKQLGGTLFHQKTVNDFWAGWGGKAVGWVVFFIALIVYLILCIFFPGLIAGAGWVPFAIGLLFALGFTFGGWAIRESARKDALLEQWATMAAVIADDESRTRESAVMTMFPALAGDEVELADIHDYDSDGSKTNRINRAAFCFSDRLHKVLIADQEYLEEIADESDQVRQQFKNLGESVSAVSDLLFKYEGASPVVAALSQNSVDPFSNLRAVLAGDKELHTAQDYPAMFSGFNGKVLSAEASRFFLWGALQNCRSPWGFFSYETWKDSNGNTFGKFGEKLGSVIPPLRNKMASFAYGPTFTLNQKTYNFVVPATLTINNIKTNPGYNDPTILNIASSTGYAAMFDSNFEFYRVPGFEQSKGSTGYENNRLIYTYKVTTTTTKYDPFSNKPPTTATDIWTQYFEVWDETDPPPTTSPFPGVIIDAQQRRVMFDLQGYSKLVNGRSYGSATALYPFQPLVADFKTPYGIMELDVRSRYYKDEYWTNRVDLEEYGITNVNTDDTTPDLTIHTPDIGAFRRQTQSWQPYPSKISETIYEIASLLPPPANALNITADNYFSQGLALQDKDTLYKGLNQIFTSILKHYPTIKEQGYDGWLKLEELHNTRDKDGYVLLSLAPVLLAKNEWLNDLIDPKMLDNATRLYNMQVGNSVVFDDETQDLAIDDMEIYFDKRDDLSSRLFNLEHWLAGKYTDVTADPPGGLWKMLEDLKTDFYKGSRTKDSAMFMADKLKNEKYYWVEYFKKYGYDYTYPYTPTGDQKFDGMLEEVSQYLIACENYAAAIKIFANIFDGVQGQIKSIAAELHTQRLKMIQALNFFAKLDTKVALNKDIGELIYTWRDKSGYWHIIYGYVQGDEKTYYDKKWKKLTTDEYIKQKLNGDLTFAVVDTYHIPIAQIPRPNLYRTNFSSRDYWLMLEPFAQVNKNVHCEDSHTLLIFDNGTKCHFENYSLTFKTWVEAAKFDEPRTFLGWTFYNRLNIVDPQHAKWGPIRAEIEKHMATDKFIRDQKNLRKESHDDKAVLPDELKTGGIIYLEEDPTLFYKIRGFMEDCAVWSTSQLSTKWSGQTGGHSIWAVDLVQTGNSPGTGAVIDDGALPVYK